MTGEVFKYKAREYDGVPITENYTLWVKEKEISDDRTDDAAAKFATLDEALDYRLDDGRTVGEIVSTWAAMPEFVLDGDPPIVWHTKEDENMSGITYEEARKKAGELKDDIDRCVEYKDAWLFVSKKDKYSIGGPSEPVVVLKENGKVVNQTYYYDVIGGGNDEDEIRSFKA